MHDYVLQWLDKLLTENEISFIKWDYNRNWAEPGWPAVPVEQQKNVYVDFTRNYYDILAQLRKRSIRTLSSKAAPVVEVVSISA